MMTAPFFRWCPMGSLAWVLFLIASCSSGSGSIETTRASVDARAAATGEQPLWSPEPYALVVDFGTAGDARGIDREAAARLDAIVGRFRRPLARTTTSLGLEGEREVCFALHELDAQERATLVDRVHREVGSGANVVVRDDVPCRLFP